MPERPEEVTVTIDGRRWSAFSDFALTLSLDAPAEASFSAPFEPERPEFRETFQPFTYKLMEVRVGDEVVFTGTIMGVDPEIGPDERSVRVSAYSAPGVLMDCPPPASAWPLELNGMRLSAIAQALLAPFGLTAQVEGDEGAAFRRVAVRPDQDVYGFLVDLAKQRGMILTTTSSGALRIYRPTSGGAPRVRLREGAPPLIAVAPSFDPQSYFSEMTGQARGRAGRGGSGYTVQNERLSGVVRPSVFTLEDTDDADVPTAVRARLSRMFGNMVSVLVELPTWRDPEGSLWEPNSTLLLEAPGAMLYRESEWLVRDVGLTQDAERTKAVLGLVLPGAFSGEVPDQLPWEA